MTKGKFIAVLTALLLVVVLGVASLFLTDTVGGAEFSKGKSVVVYFGYIEENDLNAVEAEMDNIVSTSNLIVQSKRYMKNNIDTVKGIVYVFGDLTDEQIAAFSSVGDLTGVDSVLIGDNNSEIGKSALIWGGVSLAIISVLFVVIMLFACGKIGRVQITVSSFVVLVLNVLAALATSMVLSYAGIKFTVASLTAVIAVAVYSIILSTVIANRLINAKEQHGTSASVYSEVRKPVLFSTLIIAIALIGFSASLSIYVISATAPLFVGVVFAALTNLQVLMPLKDNMSKK